MIISFLFDFILEGYKADFKIRGRNGEYDIGIKIIDGQPLYEVSSCPCEWGSFRGQSKANKDKICAHLKEALEYLTWAGWIGDEWKYGNKNTTTIENTGQETNTG